MLNNTQRHFNIERKRAGVALIFALIVLGILTSLGYSLVSYISSKKNRQQYLIDYQKARYACDSGIRYALAIFDNIEIKYAQRADQPDFSDVFWMDDKAYLEYRQNWSEMIDQQRIEQMEQQDEEKKETLNALSEMLSLFGLGDPNSLIASAEEKFTATEPNTLTVPGPYGPQWPLVVKPEEIEVGDVKVKIWIEDENAKLPVTMAMLDESEWVREKKACFATFFEWMGADKGDVEDFFDQIEEIT